MLTKNQQDHIANALIFMCRYSYPRKTSADMASVSALKSLWELVPNQQRKKIVEEIKENKDLYQNEPCLWNDFLEWESKDEHK